VVALRRRAVAGGSGTLFRSLYGTIEGKVLWDVRRFQCFRDANRFHDPGAASLFAAKRHTAGLSAPGGAGNVGLTRA